MGKLTQMYKNMLNNLLIILKSVSTFISYN